jgi:hypothetical protein
MLDLKLRFSCVIFQYDQFKILLQGKNCKIINQAKIDCHTRPVQDAPTAWESGLTSKVKNVAVREKATNRAAMTMDRRVTPNSGTPHGLQEPGVPAVKVHGGKMSGFPFHQPWIIDVKLPSFAKMQSHG